MCHTLQAEKQMTNFIESYFFMEVTSYNMADLYLGTDKSLARPGRKQARKHVRDARYFNNIEKRPVIKFVFLQGKAPKEIHAILTETVACFLPGRAKDLSAPLYWSFAGTCTRGSRFNRKLYISIKVQLRPRNGYRRS